MKVPPPSLRQARRQETILLAIRHEAAGDDRMLMAERLREVISYNPETGVFVWRGRFGPKFGILGKLEILAL